MTEQYRAPDEGSAERILSPEERTSRIAHLESEDLRLGFEWKALSAELGTVFQALRREPADASALDQLESLMKRQSEIVLDKGVIEHELFRLLTG